MIDTYPTDNGFAFIVVMLCVLHIKKKSRTGEILLFRI